MLRTHRVGKGPGGCGGRGLGSRNRRGPGLPPTPGLRGQGTSHGSPAGFLGLNGQGKLPPLLSSPSHLPLLISPASVLCLQGPTQPGGGLGGQGTGLGTQQDPRARVCGAITFCSSPPPPGGPLPPASPILPWASFLCSQGPT